LKKLQATGAEVGAPVNGVRNNPPILHDIKARLDEIGMVGCLSEVEEVEVFNLRS
jgi:hypothetical protein